MGLISFIEEAGEKLLHTQPAPASTASTASTASAASSASSASTASTASTAPDLAQLNAAAGAAIAKYIAAQNLTAENLKVTYDGATKTVTVAGVAPDQATREKIVLCCGNVHSVAKVDDQLTVAQQSAPAAATLCEVKPGDTLSKIAKSVYGNANAYEKIFEANKPMLKDPNKIYPGQKLRIPPAT